jgi:flagellar biosynthesis/type III secretory pathway protein FliH
MDTAARIRVLAEVRRRALEQGKAEGRRDGAAEGGSRLAALEQRVAELERTLSELIETLSADATRRLERLDDDRS